MNHPSTHWKLLAPTQTKAARFMGFFVFLILLGIQSTAVAADKKLPSWEDIASYIDRHFQNTPDFEPGDIISESNVEPLLDGLEKLGWTVLNRKEILNSVPKDSDYVVKQLRTKPGYKFMRQISGYPMCYDRLYHLAAIPRGRQQVYDLIRTKGGYEMIEYMTTTQLGKNLGTQLSKIPQGANFNKPTGLIYTATDLKAELQESYAETLKVLQAAAK